MIIQIADRKTVGENWRVKPVRECFTGATCKNTAASGGGKVIVGDVRRHEPIMYLAPADGDSIKTSASARGNNDVAYEIHHLM